jgi:peptidoglycan/xylan/chitin deacetylase (PgdA/CDA1 family)
MGWVAVIAEGKMRVVVIVFAALLTLGLAAFGVVAAQRANAPAAATAMAAQVAPPVQSARPTPVRAPVSDIAQTPAPEAAKPTVATDGPAAAPIVLAQNAPAAAAAPQSAATPAPSPVKSAPACDKPDGMGLARTVEIDTTGGPAFGTEHFKQYDFLREKEVVLTFDDGPWPENTPAVIKALTDMCVKGTFFEIGEHATWRPDISKMVAAAGMTVGSHTWSHKDLARKPYATDIEQAKQEIEMGVSAVHMAVDGPIAPFFRFPDLQQPADLMTYLGTRNIAIFSTDIDTFDFKLRKPEDVVKSAMTKLAKNGKGILLMHDFQHATAEAVPELLRQLKAGGYKIVHMVPKQPVTTVSKYDDMVRAQDKFSNANNTRPQTSVVKTISE